MAKKTDSQPKREAPERAGLFLIEMLENYNGKITNNVPWGVGMEYTATAAQVARVVDELGVAKIVKKLGNRMDAEHALHPGDADLESGGGDG